MMTTLSKFLDLHDCNICSGFAMRRALETLAVAKSWFLRTGQSDHSKQWLQRILVGFTPRNTSDYRRSHKKKIYRNKYRISSHNHT